MVQTEMPKTGRATFGYTLLVCGFLLLGLAIVLIFASVMGSQRLPLASSLCAFTGKSNWGLSPEQQALLLELRLAPILLGTAVGRCLSTSGAGYHAVMRNPLYEPFLLGVSDGAAV